MDAPPLRGRFGPFEIDPLRQRLRRNGGGVPLGRRSLELLAAMLARPGETLVTIVGAGGIGKTTLLLLAPRAPGPASSRSRGRA